MNVSDSEIVSSILTTNGHVKCEDIESADLILTNTCAIRENAEKKVWQRIKYFQSIRKTNRKIRKQGYPLVGVLGCMAERIKTKLLDEHGIDFICGPDSYRDIPRLISNVITTDQKEANTRLSLEETYADINPIRETNSSSAYVSIMRGCNNMCSFCIVPFTRGRERSREYESILREIDDLANNKGIREVVLLGQNVNGYHNVSIRTHSLSHSINDVDNNNEGPNNQISGDHKRIGYRTTPGFKNLYQSKIKDLDEMRFADLLKDVAAIQPEMRVRFTSPHPKDFPPEVLEVIANTANICKSIHMPVQSGSTSVLERMRRGYTRE